VSERTDRSAPRRGWSALLNRTHQAQVAILVFLITLYRRMISPLLPPSCRYEPSCSEYARQALRRHGLWRGGRLAVLRLLRCQPFGAGGFDPVP